MSLSLLTKTVEIQNLQLAIFSNAMENSPPLTSAEKKELRGVAQRLKPHVYLGKQGLTEPVLNEIDTALLKNGLIKVRFEAEREAIRDYIVEISEKLNCEFVGSVGKVGVFFREMSEEFGAAEPQPDFKSQI